MPQSRLFHSYESEGCSAFSRCGVATQVFVCMHFEVLLAGTVAAFVGSQSISGKTSIATVAATDSSIVLSKSMTLPKKLSS